MKRDRQQQEILGEAVRNAFLKLDPRIQWKNPVMFIVFLGAILVAVWLYVLLWQAIHRKAGLICI